MQRFEIRATYARPGEPTLEELQTAYRFSVRHLPKEEYEPDPTKNFTSPFIFGRRHGINSLHMPSDGTGGMAMHPEGTTFVTFSGYVLAADWHQAWSMLYQNIPQSATHVWDAAVAPYPTSEE